jgi:hypothetical protein
MIANRRTIAFPRGGSMLVRARRPVASFCIALLALSVLQCTTIKRESAQTVIQPAVGGGEATLNDVVGVTLKDGRGLRFDEKSRVFVRADTVQAQIGNQPLAIPVSDVQQVWVQKVDNTRTSFVVTGILLAALLAFAAIGASQISY